MPLPKRRPKSKSIGRLGKRKSHSNKRSVEKDITSDVSFVTGLNPNEASKDQRSPTTAANAVIDTISDAKLNTTNEPSTSLVDVELDSESERCSEYHHSEEEISDANLGSSKKRVMKRRPKSKSIGRPKKRRDQVNKRSMKEYITSDTSFVTPSAANDQRSPTPAANTIAERNSDAELDTTNESCSSLSDVGLDSGSERSSDCHYSEGDISLDDAELLITTQEDEGSGTNGANMTVYDDSAAVGDKIEKNVIHIDDIVEVDIHKNKLGISPLDEHTYCKTSLGSDHQVIDDHTHSGPNETGECEPVSPLQNVEEIEEELESSIMDDLIYGAPSNDNIMPIGLDSSVSSSSRVEQPLQPYGPDFPKDYCELRDSIQLDQCPGQFDSMRKSMMIKFIECYEKDSVIVKMSVTISPDYAVTIRVHGQDIEPNHDIWEHIPRFASTKDNIFKILEHLSQLHVCGGNPDSDFTKLIPPGAGLSDSANQTSRAFHETGFDVDCIRSTSCELLIRKTLGSRQIRCRKCQLYRHTLRKRKWRDENKPSVPSKFTANTKLSHCELSAKASKLQSDKIILKNEVQVLKRKLAAKIQTEGEKMNPLQTIELSQLMEDCGEEIREKFDPDSFKRLFWEEQMKAVKAGGKSKGMRWHPMIIKWCLYLKSRSAKAYDILRDTGFVELPSKRTLFDYSKYIKAGHGLTTPIINHLKEECKLKGIYKDPYKQYVGILQDEVKIKEDIVYDKHTGDLVGYVDLDDIANQLNNINPDQNQQSVAKYLLVVMIQGIASNLRYPLACFATNGITSAFLMPIIWNCIEHIELICQLKVMFITCDGASSNRRFFRLHRVNQQDEITYYTENPYSTDDEPRKIYFVSCVPHLLKTIRNNFSNSQSHNNTRLLMKNHKVISWMHIVRLFEEHCENNIYAICKKLTRDHIDLTTFGRMKVNLAAQVMSNTVATALEQIYGDEVAETVKFIRMVNRFFDCCNTRSPREAIRTRNPDMAVYESVEDARLAWLKDDFLGYFTEWKDEIEREMRGHSAPEKAMRQISYQTLEGLFISVNSIVELTKYCLNSGIPYVRTAIFNQDNLEAHFSHYRHKGGANDNPTAFEAMHILANMRTTESQALAPVRANIRGNALRQIIDNTPLPRRPNVRQ